MSSVAGRLAEDRVREDELPTEERGHVHEDQRPIEARAIPQDEVALSIDPTLVGRLERSDDASRRATWTSHDPTGDVGDPIEVLLGVSGNPTSVKTSLDPTNIVDHAVS